MNTSKTMRPYYVPAELSGLYLICDTIRRRSLKVAIILLIGCLSLSSCATMTVNGVSFKQKKTIRREEKVIYAASFIAGFALGTHYRNKIVKK